MTKWEGKRKGEVLILTTPSASPEGFGTSPFDPLRGQKGEARNGGKGRSPFLILGAPFQSART